MTMPTLWLGMPLAAFDVESTGVSVTTDRVVTASVLRIDGPDVHARNFLANPGIPIPQAATDIHGYTTEYAEKYGRPHPEVIADIVDELYACWAEGRVVACYNGSFDFTILATHHQGFEVRGPIFDAYIADKHVDRYRPGSRKLSATCIHYGIQLDDAHDAQADALAAARLAWKMPRIYPELATLTAPELMAAQTRWHSEQTASFIDYLRRKNLPSDDVRHGWPISHAPESEAA
ncbi:3'-5' exonuclease [Nocardia farcinica]|uniref:DNA polymerase III polC-type n=2 Tax=Nocardia farcinica TaxID=37329 RepID=A0A0H5PP17_NOCFR|nr:exonuclease domain-containing protein [Nocardia farcinica]SLG32593.1 DNA polymerase III subunit epsilon [Mycobacteroides abscessus subsp. abscessus]AXK88534.1 3'-5' exonuclease [Nocardia farcinica]MBF6393852.1 3'-5' exonuclease [Nocardia farcinica]PFW98833.1 DNA polymerase III PolC-type [Nocardia farcinica]PFX04439.1 DNA polymerase III PolC-type [Nocardia farcinica]